MSVHLTLWETACAETPHALINTTEGCWIQLKARSLFTKSMCFPDATNDKEDSTWGLENNSYKWIPCLFVKTKQGLKEYSGFKGFPFIFSSIYIKLDGDLPSFISPYCGSQWLPSTVWLPAFFKISSFLFNRTKKPIQTSEVSKVLTW